MAGTEKLTATPEIAARTLQRLGLSEMNAGAACGGYQQKAGDGEMSSVNPATGEVLARVRLADADDYEAVVTRSVEIFRAWRMTPAPERGQLVREIGEELRAAKQDLGTLVSLEVGKILPEGLGEVQEMIDVADFAVGLSRQLYGFTMQSERRAHRMYEQWHPLGPVGVITAFNFPVAVWSWNALIAAVCGDTVVWKPSPEAPLCALAVQKLCDRVLERRGWAGVFSTLVGTVETIGHRMIEDRRFPLISATGSCRMGRHVAEVVGRRLGRTLLELGGNNAVIVMPDARLELVQRAVAFGAIGTAGQRCTSIRRLFLHRQIAREMTDRLLAIYRQVRIGSPLAPGVLMGPLINEAAVQRMQEALSRIREQGGEILCGGRPLGGCFVEPALVRSHPTMPILQEEIFAPILHLIEFDDLDQVLEWHNGVPQGLSSAMFTLNLQWAERFLSARGSDCGIANINLGTSGAEIGGAFGGEKDTGGGREAGSDAWKAYMRRQTVTINWSDDLPLAQGIEFPL